MSPEPHLHARTTEIGGCIVCFSSRSHVLVDDNDLQHGPRWSVAVAGDIVDQQTALLTDVERAVQHASYGGLREVEGSFALASFDSTAGQLALISDRRAQYPLYWFADSECVLFGTFLAPFCRLGFCAPDERWIWESLYFNFPVSDLSILKSVNRVSAASIVKFERPRPGVSLQTSKVTYAQDFRVREPLVRGKAGLARAVDVLSERIPKYVSGAETVACPLTAGWDGRTVLSLVPTSRVTAYTYGVPGCLDLECASRLAAALKLPHVRILFDQEVIRRLPQLMMDTVWLSSGAQGVKRATLLHAYRTLTDGGSRFPVVTSGVFLDCLFRGHAASPSLVSADVADLFEGRTTRVIESRWRPMLGDAYDAFAGTIEDSLESMRGRFGSFRSPSMHLAYLVYCVAPRYFGGEMTLAHWYTTWRVPAWDGRIIDLACSIEQSTLNYSQFAGHVRGRRDEVILQSLILARAGSVLAKTPIRNAAPRFVLLGSMPHSCYVVLRALKRRTFSRQTTIPVEDWKLWLEEANRDWVADTLLQPSALLRDFVERNYLEGLRLNGNGHLIGKLLTIEITLRLLRSRWTRFW